MRNVGYNKVLCSFFNCLFLICFICSCTNIAKSSYGGSCDGRKSDLSHSRLPSNDSTNNQDLNFRLINSIKNKDVEGLKECLSTDDIRKIMRMLRAQDENGNTPFHILSVPNKPHDKLFEWIIQKLIYLLCKNGKNIKDAIKNLLTIENKALQNVLERTTKMENKVCIDTLSKKVKISDTEEIELISKDQAEYAKKAIHAIRNGGLQLEDKKILLGGVLHKNLAVFQLVLESKSINNLLEKNQEDNTIFHLGAEKCSESSEHINHIFTKVLDNIEIQKNRLQDCNIKQVINDCLIIKNNQSMNFIDILTSNGCNTCLKKLVEYEYTIPHDIANCAIICANDDPDNKAVQFLKEYIKGKYYNEIIHNKNDIIAIPIEKTFGSSLVENNNINHVTNSDVSPYCQKTFTHKENLKRHIESVHEGKRSDPCRYCQKTFTHKENLKRHIESVHEGKRSDPCRYCQKTFTRKWYLKEHIESVHEGKRYDVCRYCQKTFTHKWYLKKHIETVHEGKRYDVCRYCQKTFIQKGNLKKHVETVHEGKRSDPCPHCQKTFTKKGYLKEHIETVHEGKRSDPCLYCQETFTQKGNLKEHIEIAHEGKRSDVCLYCQKTFTHKWYLKKHIETVHEGKRYDVCRYCQKTFTQKGNLKEHIESVHEGKRSDPCPYCQKTFTQKGSLKEHIETAHEGKRSDPCPYCQKTFTKKRGLKKHIKTCFFSSEKRPIQEDEESASKNKKMTL